MAALNRFFDGLFIHADPKLVRLEQTFGRTGEIEIPIHYTGFITPKPSDGCRKQIRQALFRAEEKKLIIASIGGGSVGHELLSAAAEAVEMLVAKGRPYHLQIFTGPYCSESTASQLRKRSSDHITVRTFTDNFVNWLAAADLSISMAGYNTCMNTVAARVPALMFPFGQNREQRLRIATLWPDGNSVFTLTEDDLQAARLPSLIDLQIEKGYRAKEIDISGTAATLEIIEHGCR